MPFAPLQLQPRRRYQSIQKITPNKLYSMTGVQGCSFWSTITRKERQTSAEKQTHGHSPAKTASGSSHVTYHGITVGPRMMRAPSAATPKLGKPSAWPVSRRASQTTTTSTASPLTIRAMRLGSLQNLPANHCRTAKGPALNCQVRPKVTSPLGICLAAPRNGRQPATMSAPANTELFRPIRLTTKGSNTRGLNFESTAKPKLTAARWCLRRMMKNVSAARLATSIESMWPLPAKTLITSGFHAYKSTSSMGRPRQRSAEAIKSAAVRSKLTNKAFMTSTLPGASQCENRKTTCAKGG